MSPARALAYRPLRSRASQTAAGVATWISRKSPTSLTMRRTCARAASYGATGGAPVRAGGLVGSDGRAERDTAVRGDLGGHVPDPGDVQVTVGPGEGETRRQQLPDQVSVEQRHRPVAALGQGVAQRPGD